MAADEVIVQPRRRYDSWRRQMAKDSPTLKKRLAKTFGDSCQAEKWTELKVACVLKASTVEQIEACQ